MGKEPQQRGNGAAGRQHSPVRKYQMPGIEPEPTGNFFEQVFPSGRLDRHRPEHPTAVPGHDPVQRPPAEAAVVVEEDDRSRVGDRHPPNLLVPARRYCPMVKPNFATEAGAAPLTEKKSMSLPAGMVTSWVVSLQVVAAPVIPQKRVVLA